MSEWNVEESKFDWSVLRVSRKLGPGGGKKKKLFGLLTLATYFKVVETDEVRVPFRILTKSYEKQSVFVLRLLSVTNRSIFQMTLLILHAM